MHLLSAEGSWLCTLGSDLGITTPQEDLTERKLRYRGCISATTTTEGKQFFASGAAATRGRLPIGFASCTGPCVLFSPFSEVLMSQSDEKLGSWTYYLLESDLGG